MQKCLQFLRCPRRVINYLAPASYQDLRIAIIKYDLRKIDSLLYNGASVYGRGQTILHFCVNEKNIQILQKLCKKYPDLIDERNDDGDSPFMLAIFLKYQQGIQYLIRYSKINICDNNGNTAFIIAASNGDIETLKLLLTKNSQCAFVKNFQGQNALHRACYYGQIDVVLFLINNTHLKFGMKDQKGNTSLHLACQGLSFAVARYIVKKVKNWKEILLIQNKQNNDPFDIMLNSINKIDDKNGKYTKQSLQMTITDQVLNNSFINQNGAKSQNNQTYGEDK